MFSMIFCVIAIKTGTKKIIPYQLHQKTHFNIELKKQKCFIEFYIREIINRLFEQTFFAVNFLWKL